MVDDNEIIKAKKSKISAYKNECVLKAESELLEQELILAKARLKAKKSMESEHSPAYLNRKARNHALCVFAAEIEAITKSKLDLDNPSQLENWRLYLKKHKNEIIKLFL